MMKKSLLFLVMTLMPLASVFAQDAEGEEGAEQQTPVAYTKSLQSVIDDAKFLVSDSHYTTGQSELQAAIDVAEGRLAEFANPTLDPDETTAEAMIRLNNDGVYEAMRTLQAAIDAFVFGNGHADATEKIQNPSFDKDNNNSKTVTSWTVSNFKQNKRDVNYGTNRFNENSEAYNFRYFVEQWIAAGNSLAGSGDINQVVTGLPAGHYRLTADVFVHNQKYSPDNEEAVGVELYANDAVREIGFVGLDDNKTAAFSVDFDITEGQDASIGLRFADVNFNWLGLDNITLLYIGDPEIYNNIANAEKLAAAKEALAASLTAAKETLANEAAPLYRNELQAAIDVASEFGDGATLEALEEAKATLDAEVKTFNSNNKYFTDLQAAIESAEALLNDETMTEGKKAFQQAIDDAKAALESAKASAADTETAIEVLQSAQTALGEGQSNYGIVNASYAHPANVITNGKMSSYDGWDILHASSTNPDIKINTSGDYSLFSKPFMECWIASGSSLGQENYARQTVTALPNGLPLPAGYYVLKAAALATQQGDAALDVTGVTLKLGEEEVAVQTANGVPEMYTLYFNKTDEGGELTFGLFIDAATDANWVAWDEVELQYVGDKDKYMSDYAAAVLGESMDKLKAAVADANALLENVDLNGVDFEGTELGFAMGEAQFYIENPTDEDATEELFNQLISDINEGMKKFYTSGVSPKDGLTFDFTSFIQNAEFDVQPGEEWTAEAGVLPGGTDCANWWFGSSGPSDLIQDFSQTIEDMPAGNYLLEVKAAVRVDMNYATDNYTEDNLPTYLTACKVYANADSADVHPFFYEDEAKGLTLENMLLMTNEYDYRHGNGTLIDDMLKGTDYFRTYIPFTLTEAGEIKVGFHIELPQKAGQMPFIDYFHLSYYGNQEIDIETITAIEEVAAQAPAADTSIYDLQGRKVAGKLTPGIYIRDGKKVLVK